MYRITLIVLLFLLLPDLYIWLAHLLRRRSVKLPLRLTWWLPSLLLAAVFVCYMHLSGDNPMSRHPQAIGRIGALILLLGIPKLLFIPCSVLGLAAHAVTRRCPRLPFNIAGGMLAVVGLAGTCYAVTAGTTRFEVKEVEYRSPQVPEGFDGYRIVQLSDIHIGSWLGKQKEIAELVELVNSQGADLIVFTGDLVNQQSHEIDGFQEILTQLHASDGVYSILGNHDYGDYYRWNSAEEKRLNMAYLQEQQQEMGWKLLNNEHAVLHHGNDSIALIGVENDGEPPFPQYADLPRAMQGTEGMFSILLSHNPTHWRREVLTKSDIPLMLAGHTHAMQLIVLGHSPASWKYPEWAGLYREGAQSLYVNVGVGFVGLPIRFGAWPEITVLTLRR